MAIFRIFEKIRIEKHEKIAQISVFFIHPVMISRDYTIFIRTPFLYKYSYSILAQKNHKTHILFSDSFILNQEET